MDNKCSKCGGELISSRLSTGASLSAVKDIEFRDSTKFKKSN